MSENTRPLRILFVTIGQSPRHDLLDELTEDLAPHAHITEIGLLDGLSGSEIDSLKAQPGQSAFVTRLANGVWLSLLREEINKLAHDRIAAVGEGEFDLVVLISTGLLRELESTCPTVNAQRAVDAVVISMAAQGDKIGLMLPLKQQTLDLDIPSVSLFETVFNHAAHGNYEQLQKAARALKDCAYIVLNSVSYSEADRQVVADVSGKPVILPRRIIANSIQLVLNSLVKTPTTEVPSGLRADLESLTNRERQVMSLVCEGLPNKAIARQLGISHKTVEIHRSNVLRKMKASSSGALIRQMVRAGFA